MPLKEECQSCLLLLLHYVGVKDKQNKKMYLTRCKIVHSLLNIIKILKFLTHQRLIHMLSVQYFVLMNYVRNLLTMRVLFSRRFNPSFIFPCCALPTDRRSSIKSFHSTPNHVIISCFLKRVAAFIIAESLLPLFVDKSDHDTMGCT